MPYGLNVTMPAMILEHLIFGLVEALVTVLIFVYIRNSDPGLLTDKSPGKKGKAQRSSATKAPLN